MREIEDKASEIKRRKPPFQKFQQLRQQVEQGEKRLSNMDSEAGVRETRLEEMSRDSLQAYRWLLDHPDEFEKEIFGPPVVTCSVKDGRYTDALETLMAVNDMKCFTAQTRSDFRKLQSILCGQMKLGDIAIRTCSIPFESFSSPWSDEQLKANGFDGWAKDFLVGPAPVLAMLCSEKKFHVTPVALRDISEAQFDRVSADLNSWVSGRRSYRVSRRLEYGPSAKSTSVVFIKAAHNWKSGSVNASIKNDLQSNVRMWKQELQEFRDNDDSEKRLMARLRDERDEVEKERVCIAQWEKR